MPRPFDEDLGYEADDEREEERGRSIVRASSSFANPDSRPIIFVTDLLNSVRSHSVTGLMRMRSRTMAKTSTSIEAPMIGFAACGTAPVIHVMFLYQLG